MHDLLRRCPVPPSSSTLVLALALAVLGTPRTSNAAVDFAAPGAHDVGYTRTTFTRTATLTPLLREMDTVIWYPATAGDQPGDALGHRDAAVVPGRHPVLVYSHGGCAFPEVSAYLTRALASWGFVVVAPSHPGDTAYDGVESCDFDELRGPTLIERVADVRFVLDALQDEAAAPGSMLFERLELARIGIFGWSSGASTALVAGRDDARIDAVLSLAPDARPERIGVRPLAVPTMVMEGELDFYDPEQTALTHVFRMLRAPRFAIELRRTGHFAFSDECYADLLGSDECAPGTLTQAEAHRVVLRFAVPFLLRYVAGRTDGAYVLQAGAGLADAEVRADLGRRQLARPH